ncbi:MAG TPA: hypothetical protein PLB41_17690, partial [Rubrivivax sp.]|nr:hypothetical protein [Rubrivivax sp.]
QLKALIVGKAFWLQNNVTGEQFSQNFTTEGNTIVFRVGANATTPSATGRQAQEGYEGATSRYQIQGGKLITWVAQEPYSLVFYKLGDTTYAARSNEFGYANYEIIAAPQFAQNPLNAMANQFSLELGLTEEQRGQIVPFLKQEVTKLGELKKDKSLTALQKVQKLKEFADTVDGHIKPLLNAEQQQKFDALRTALRRQMAEQVVEKAADKLKQTIRDFHWNG